MSLLELKGLWITKKTREMDPPLLCDVNLIVYKKSLTIVIGESGAGKTLLAKSLAGLVPENLVVRFQQLKYRDCEVDGNWLEKERGKKIFYIPQNATASLNPVLKIKNQIYAKGVSLATFNSLLESLNIIDPPKILNSYPFQNSEGENQRVLLSMALIQNPELLILDEPTSALDREGVRDFWEILKKTMEKFEISVLALTHDLSILQRAHYVYVVQGGKIVDYGEFPKIFNEPVHNYTKEIASYLNR